MVVKYAIRYVPKKPSRCNKQNMCFFTSKKDRYQRQGQNYLIRGKYRKALECFQKAILLEDSSENLFNLALAFIALKKFEQAEKYLEKIHLNYPDNEINSLSLADCYLRQRKWKKAINIYKELVEKNPRNKSYKKYLTRAEDVVDREKYINGRELFDQAQLESEKKNHQSAADLLLQALEYTPDDPNLLNNLAFALMKLKKYSPAYKYIERALQLSPHNEKIKKNLLAIKRKLRR